MGMILKSFFSSHRKTQSICNSLEPFIYIGFTCLRDRVFWVVEKIPSFRFLQLIVGHDLTIQKRDINNIIKIHLPL